MRHQGIEPVLWDVLKGGDTLPAVDTVVYCVGYDRSLGLPIRDIYVGGLENTLEHLPSPRRLLYVSSTGVYGGHGGNWIDEETPPAPEDDAGRACLEAEGVLASVAKRHGLDFVILRLAGIYGPGRLIGGAALQAGQPIRGEPDVHLNLIHVEDAAQVVDAASIHATSGKVYLVADGRPPTRRDFYSYLAELLQTAAPSFDPGRAARSRGDRQICSDFMFRELKVNLIYPDFRAGLRQSVATSR